MFYSFDSLPILPKFHACRMILPKAWHIGAIFGTDWHRKYLFDGTNEHGWVFLEMN